MMSAKLTKQCLNRMIACFLFFSAQVFDRVRDLLRDAGERTVVWTVLGQRVCLRAWKSLHNLGCLMKLSLLLQSEFGVVR